MTELPDRIVGVAREDATEGELVEIDVIDALTELEDAPDYLIEEPEPIEWNPWIILCAFIIWSVICIGIGFLLAYWRWL